MRPVLGPWPTLVAWLVGVAVLTRVPWMGVNAADVRLLTLVAILALTVSSLNLTLGFAGELALAQVAIYAAGAYTTGYVAINVTDDLLVCLCLSVAVAVVIGVVTGLPGTRLGGWTLAITSFFVVLLVPSVIKIFGDTLGGLAGLNGIPLPTIAGRELDGPNLYVVVVVVTAAWFAIFRNIAVSPRGAALLVLKESPVLAAAMGTSPRSTKLTAYALGAVPAGVAGCFFAFLDSYLSPLTFGLDLAIVILAASILGGPRSVYGAIVGAAIMQIGPMRATEFDQYAPIAYGAFLILGGILLRNGLAGLTRRPVGSIRRRFTRRRPAADPAAGSLALPGVEGRVLEVSHVTKRFGGNLAVDDVSFAAQPGQITALVGPNGSGKTTLMNLVSGYYRVDDGAISLGGTRLTGLPAHRVAREGVGRTFQTPLVPEGLDVEDTIATGRLATHRVSLWSTALRLPAHWRTAKEERRSSAEIMASLGLDGLAHVPASSLALGTRRMLELGRAVASGSAVVLLDEVASGLDEGDIEGLVEVLLKMRDAGVTVLLVEHNFALVRAVADRVVVLAQGRVLAEGSAEEIAAHPDVVRTYLGEGGEISGTRIGRSDDVTEVGA